MGKDFFTDKWDALKDAAKEKWDLTDENLAKIEGRRDEMIESLKKKYGGDIEKAKAELLKWEKEKEKDFLSKFKK